MPGKNIPEQDLIDQIGPIWRELWNDVWHVTHPERFLSILDDGAILPNPNIPDKVRWKTARGAEFYPYVRSIDGVSIFDFRDFDAVWYQEHYPLSSWHEFVNLHRDFGKWTGAVWLRLNAPLIEPQTIWGKQLVAKWKEDNRLGQTIMPRIECAHIGPIPLACICQIIFIRSRDNGTYHTWKLENFDRPAYENLVTEWRKDYETLRNRPRKIHMPSSDVPHDLAARLKAAKRRLKRD